MFSSSAIKKFGIALVLLMVVGFGVALAYSMTGNEIMRGQDIVNAEADGTLISSNSSCNFANGTAYPATTATTEGTFAACVQNTGSCTGPSSRLMTYNDAIACRVISSTIGQVTDQWLASSGTYWPVTSGSVYFNADTSLPGVPANTRYVGGSGYVQQQLSPSSIVSGTTIFVRAYMQVTTNSSTDSDPTCGTNATTTATGIADLQIVRSNGTVVADTQTTGGSGWIAFSASVTVPATDSYYARLVVSKQSAGYTISYQNANGICVSHTGTVSGEALITSISASNS